MERRRGRSRLGLRRTGVKEEQCGCVPQVSLVSYEDLAGGGMGRDETEKRQGWTKRLTLLWCGGGGGDGDNVVKRRNNIVTREHDCKLVAPFAIQWLFSEAFQTTPLHSSK